MDRWAAAEVALMEAIGNRRGEAFYLANPPSSSNGLLTKYSSNEEVKRFIERKYVSKEFAVNNVEELLRKIHKQVGYQKLKQHESGLTTGDTRSVTASDKAGVATKKVDPEQVVRALYGDATTSELTSKMKTIVQKNERKSQTIHGTFGVVNVNPEEYLDRFTMVLRAFEIDREVVESALDDEGNEEEKTKLLG
ncbi:unnamed protein product [Phytomonas sp. EM1]|nr:unnamed protein product [Phytomonas sp. EM1]|eukprot:CCW59559.1 unnamed protein product [Phytomonas sp. isolate EM1]